MALVEPTPTNSGMDPVLIASLTQAGIAAGQAITRGGPRRQYKWNKKAMKDAQKINRANAEWALKQNERLSQEQRMYDSPASQMARYKQAGLNPHLIYGQGSSGNMGSPISVGSLPPASLQPPDASYPDIFGDYLQAGQTMAQTGLTVEKREESQVKQSLMQAQETLVRANPHLDPVRVNALRVQFQALADIKAQERDYLLQTPEERAKNKSQGYAKMDADIQAIWDKSALDSARRSEITKGLDVKDADLAIKAEILKSEQFKNAILEKSKEWLVDGNIGPAQIMSALMMLFGKMM